MNMNKNVLEHMDKAAYIILLCIAAVAVLVSMVTGPLGYKSLSIGAAVSAAIAGIPICLPPFCGRIS